MQKKKIPERKCLGCGESKPKNTLVRVLRAPDGTVSLDLTGKKSGRGAYICNDKECFEKARKKRSLERALKCTIPPELYDSLLKQIENE